MPRLEKIFMAKETTVNMRWPESPRLKDGVLRHSTDSEVWKTHATYMDFSTGLLNVRLALSIDGFELFKHGTSHSIWPVTLVQSSPVDVYKGTLLYHAIVDFGSYFSR